MHSLWSRANALLTNFLLVAAAMAALTSITDYINVPPLPDVKISIKSVMMKPSRSGDDQASFRAHVKADLTPYWTWNTKQMFTYLQVEYITERNKVNQVSIWDDILTKKHRVALDQDVKQEYAFLDQGNFLRGTDVKMTLVWDVMPKVGALRRFSVPVAVGSMPPEYVEKAAAWDSWLIDPPKAKGVEDL